MFDGCAVSNDTVAHYARMDRQDAKESKALAAADEWQAELIETARKAAPQLWAMTGEFAERVIDAVGITAYDVAWERAKREFGV